MYWFEKAKFILITRRFQNQWHEHLEIKETRYSFYVIKVTKGSN